VVIVAFYQEPDGTKPVGRYMRELPPDERAIVQAKLRLLEQHGLARAPVDKRQVDGKLWELRITAHRLFYVLVTREALVVLHGYRKKSQKAHAREISIARERMENVLRAQEES